MMWDTALALAALLVLPVIYFGPRPLLLALCATAVAARWARATLPPW